MDHASLLFRAGIAKPCFDAYRRRGYLNYIPRLGRGGSYDDRHHMSLEAFTTLVRWGISCERADEIVTELQPKIAGIGNSGSLRFSLAGVEITIQPTRHIG